MGLRSRAWRSRSSGVIGAAPPGVVGCRDGMPTSEPHLGQTTRFMAISSRARRCLPQEQTNLMVKSSSLGD
jgi:hypothetical protein